MHDTAVGRKAIRDRRLAHAAAVERRRLANSIRAIASRDGLTSYMNDTKWSRVCFGFAALPAPPRFRICDLSPPELVTDWLSDYPHEMLPFVSIRWLEVDLAPERVAETVAMCKSWGAAVEATGAGMRIWGWAGPADKPNFA